MQSPIIEQIAKFLIQNPQIMEEITEIQHKLKHGLPCKLFSAKVLTNGDSTV